MIPECFTEADKENLIRMHELRGKPSSEWYEILNCYTQLLHTRLLREIVALVWDWVFIIMSYKCLYFPLILRLFLYYSLIYYPVQLVKHITCLIYYCFKPSSSELVYLNFEIAFICRCRDFLSNKASILRAEEILKEKKNENFQSVNK